MAVHTSVGEPASDTRYPIPLLFPPPQLPLRHRRSKAGSLPAMLPLFHKFKVISRIAHMQRYSLYHHATYWQRTRPLDPDFQLGGGRSIHTTPPNQMAQLSEEPIVDLMQKLQSHPDAILAITKFMKIAHKEGFDELMSGRMPSRMELFRAFSNTTIRKAAEDMVAAFSNAGIEFDQETALKIVKHLPELSEEEPENK